MVILDIDNCIADDDWRLRFIKENASTPEERLHTYHLLAEYDDRPHLEFLPEHFISGRISIVTSRPEQYRGITRKWLDAFGLSHAALFMREDGNYEPTAELKLRIVDQIIEYGFKVLMAYDDRSDVVEAYRNAGIPASVQAINKREWLR